MLVLMKLFKYYEKKYKIHEAEFFEFGNLKLNSWELLGNYFHKKLECSRKLWLSEKIILQGLIDGLITEFKNLLKLNFPDNPLTWFETISKFKPNTRIVSLPS